MPCAAPCDRLPCDRLCDRALSCGHRCPSVCGEVCPEEHCQTCNAEKLDARVDLLEFKTYREIDVAETPIVVLGCGHFFTAESLDGHVGLGEVYAVDPSSGRFAGLEDISGAMSGGVPACPDCKRPIRQFATRRYNRVVNRAVMDEASKRFLVGGRASLDLLEARLRRVEERLEASRDDVLVRAGSGIGLGFRGQYADAVALEKDAMKLCRMMDEQNQPAKKLFDAILSRRMSTMSLDEQMGMLDVSSSQTDHQPRKPVFDKQISLGARLIQLKAQHTMLHDKFTRTKAKKSIGEASMVSYGGSPGMLAPIFMKDCLVFIEEAKEQSLSRLVIQASICYARIAVWNRSFGSSSTAIQCADTARELLQQALELCDQLQAAEDLRAGVQAIQKLFEGPRYESVTPEEISAIKLAMVSGARGINTHSGHWYNCANGHPVSSRPESPNMHL